METDAAVRVVVARPFAEAVGAVLMEQLGPFAEEEVDRAVSVALVFYPGPDEALSDDGLLALLPPALRSAGSIRLERQSVPRDWVDGWKDHFHPVVIGRIRVRPPWEAPLRQLPSTAKERTDRLIEVVINPGLGFGTGLHPTTRGALALLQADEGAGPVSVLGRGLLVDAGTGSGILAVAAAKLGWYPVIAFDNDSLALLSARENAAVNEVATQVEVHEMGVEQVPSAWFAEATILANLTLEPVLALLRRLGPGWASGGLTPCPGRESRRPRRLVVSGILTGAQEEELVSEAERYGFTPARRLYEAEWVTMELLPTKEA